MTYIRIENLIVALKLAVQHLKETGQGDTIQCKGFEEVIKDWEEGKWVQVTG